MSVPVRRTGAWIAAAALAAGGVGAATPAFAASAAHVSVSPAALRPGKATTLSLHGSGFQSIKGGFGGIYVLFGWVDGHWQPSQGGVTGVDYRYVPDSQTKDNNGYEKFVSFLDGGTEAEANGGIIAADGTWATTLTVPGATFSAVGSGGATVQVDCRTVTCGVITIGAHGVVNAENETFTPVTFTAATTPTAKATPHATGTSTGGAAPAGTPAAGAASATPEGGAGPLTLPSRGPGAAAPAATPVGSADPLAARPVAATTRLTADPRWITVLAVILTLLAVAVVAGSLRHRIHPHPAPGSARPR